MKRFAEYDITEEEKFAIFSSQESYERNLKWFNDDIVCGDTEKYRIANLLFLRGDREKSRKMIETIENNSYRNTCLHAYSSWEGMENDVHVF